MHVCCFLVFYQSPWTGALPPQRHPGRCTYVTTLPLVCSVSLTSPLCISRPASRGPRLSVTSIISSRLNVHSIKTRFTAPAILLGGAMWRLSCGFEERRDGGLAGEGSCELCGREASCVGRDLCARCAPVRTRRCSHTPQPTSCFSCPFIS